MAVNQRVVGSSPSEDAIFFYSVIWKKAIKVFYFNSFFVQDIVELIILFERNVGFEIKIEYKKFKIGINIGYSKIIGIRMVYEKNISVK